MAHNDRRSRVREPVQVYLDRSDRDLLEQAARETGLSRAEIMRRGLRRFADDILTERPPGWSLQGLISSLEDVEDLPTDLAERHDTYLYGGGESGRVGTD